MSEEHRRAVELARFYFRRTAERAGATWDSDNDVEVELMVSYVIDAAVGRLRPQLDDAIKRIRQLEDDSRDALNRIHVLEDLQAPPDDAVPSRPPRHYPASQQEPGGHLRSDCSAGRCGLMPYHGADPDRPETWAFGEPPVTAYPDHEGPS